MPDPFIPIRFLLLLLLLTAPSAAIAVSLTGNWAYRQAGGDNIETRSEFRQNYSLGVGPALSYSPSHAMAASASVGYTRRESDTGTEFITTETITPTTTFSLTNDIFLARVSGDISSTRPENGFGSSRTSWDAALLSRWDVAYFPNVRFSLSEQTENVRDSSFFADAERGEKNFSAAANWDVYLGDLSYSYSESRSEDLRSTSVVDSEAHFGRFETAGEFWNKRVGFNLAQQVQTTSQEVTATGGEDGALADVPVPSIVSYAITDFGALPDRVCEEADVVGIDCLDGFPPDSGFLGVQQGEFVHISLDAEDPVEGVTLTFDPLFAVNINALEWDLYVYNFAIDDWELVNTALPSQPPPETVAGTEQIQVLFDLTDFDPEIMLVANNNTGNDLRITEVQAFNRQPSGAKSTTFRYLSNLSARFKISKTLASSINLTLDHTEADSEEFSISNDKLTSSGNLRWSPVSYFVTTFGVSEYREMPKGGEDLLDRNYTLIFSTLPLPEMTASFSVQRNERFIDSLQTLEVTRYTISSKAQIYPDLSAALFLSYADREQRVGADGQPGETGEFVGEDTISSRLDLNARLYQKLAGDLQIRYSQSKDETGTREAGTIDVGLRSRVSEMLAFRGSYGTNYIGEGQDSLGLTMDLQVLDTHKTRLTLTATHRQADTMSQNFSLTGNWLISKNMSLVGQGSYRFAEEGNSYNFRLNLSFRI